MKLRRVMAPFADQHINKFLNAVLENSFIRFEQYGSNQNAKQFR